MSCMQFGIAVKNDLQRNDARKQLYVCITFFIRSCFQYPFTKDVLSMILIPEKNKGLKLTFQISKCQMKT